MTSKMNNPAEPEGSVPHKPKHAGKPERKHEREREDEYCDDDRPTKVVERIWYYDRDDENEGRRRCDLARDEDRRERHERDRDEDCEEGEGRGKPGRPTRPQGTDNGRLGENGGLTKSDLDHPNKPGVWVGPRANMDLPYLLMRANPTDLGYRPVVGWPFV